MFNWPYTQWYTFQKNDPYIDINNGKNFLEGQGHRVKGQGQIDDFVEKLFGL